MYQDCCPWGTSHVDFASKDSTASAVELAAQEPIHILGHDLHVYFSLDDTHKPITNPHKKLYFLGCASDEFKIRTIFQQYRM